MRNYLFSVLISLFGMILQWLSELKIRIEIVFLILNYNYYECMIIVMLGLSSRLS